MKEERELTEYIFVDAALSSGTIEDGAAMDTGQATLAAAVITVTGTIIAALINTSCGKASAGDGNPPPRSSATDGDSASSKQHEAVDSANSGDPRKVKLNGWVLTKEIPAHKWSHESPPDRIYGYGSLGNENVGLSAGGESVPAWGGRLKFRMVAGEVQHDCSVTARVDVHPTFFGAYPDGSTVTLIRDQLRIVRVSKDVEILLTLRSCYVKKPTDQLSSCHIDVVVQSPIED